MKNSDIRHSHWLGLVNIYLHAKNYQNITSGLKVFTQYSVSENFASTRLSHWSSLVNIYLYAKYYQNIP